MALFPGALPAAGSASASDTLAAAGHTSLHNTGADESRAIATKVGTGASTPTSGTFLRGNGVGTSAWGQAVLTSDVSGILPTTNGGTGQSNLTNLPLTTPVISNPTISGGGSWSGSPTLVTPTIADLTNSQHNHENAAGGGQLNGANAITDGTITPAELVSGTGSSWAWQTWTPTFTNFTKGSAAIVAKYIQIGKTVIFKLDVTWAADTSASGTIVFSLPVTAASDEVPSTGIGMIGVGNALDSGTNQFNLYVQMASTTTASMNALVTSGGFASPSAVNATVPMTWTTNDRFNVKGTYEAA